MTRRTWSRSGIFDAFTQLEGSQVASAGGLGLGLALVKSLTELHGGAVTVVSEGRDRGSAFHIRLPLHTPSDGGENRASWTLPVLAGDHGPA
ncbi:MAG: ATP-binding protein [Aeromicrobium sp.]